MCARRSQLSVAPARRARLGRLVRSPNPARFCSTPPAHSPFERIRSFHQEPNAMNHTLTQSARKLRLSGLLTSLELRLQEAQSHQLPHAQFLELVFQDELNVREQRRVERRRKLASFRDTKTLEDFDWAVNTSIKRQQFYDLATGQFIGQRRDVLLIGPPDLGKRHLAQAIGQHAIKAAFLLFDRSLFDSVRELPTEVSPPQ